MKSHIGNFKILAASVACLGFSLVVKTNKPPIHIPKQDSKTTINTAFLKTFSLGNKRLISDVVWIQTLLESDTEHYKKKDFNNWMYLRFNQISDLDPHFYENYLYGSLYLSVIKDDPFAAEKIYDKALIYYPNDYKLLFNAGFNSYFEKGDFAKGYGFLEKIQNHPDLPIPMKSVIAKLKFQLTMDYDVAFEMVKQNYELHKIENVRNKLRSDLYAIKAEKDLKCLNEVKSHCELKDLDGVNYVFENGKYRSAKPFTPFRINLRK
jgi:hypothetical protein